MKIRTLKNRFLLIFIFGAVIISLIAVFGIYGMVSGHRAYENLLAEQESLGWFINHMKEDIRDSRVEIFTMYVEKDAEQRLQYKDKIVAIDKDIDVDLELMIYSDLLNNRDSLRKKLMELKSQWDLFKGVRYSRLIPLLLAGNDAEAGKVLSGIQKERYLSMERRLDEAYSITEKLVKDQHEAINARERSLIYTVLAIMMLGSVSGAVVFYINFHYILSRINELKEGTDRVSQGDLSSRVAVEGEDEIATLGEAFNHMADWIQEDMDTMLRSERELQERNERLNEAMVEAQQHAKVIEFAVKEREKQNKQLVEMQSQLLQSEKMASVGQLAAGVAHEINNPVGYVNGNMSTLSAYIDDVKALDRRFMEFRAAVLDGNMERGRELAADIARFREDKDVEFVFEDITKLLAESREGLERVTTIVRDLKHFSHVDEAERREFDINKGIESTINVAWNEIKYKAEVRRDYSELPPVFCYPQQLNQVFMNILVNAAHAIDSSSGKGLIGIRTYQREDNVFIEISDNGSGIPEDKIERIFEPFFTTKPVGKGTGLGLSMAYSIISKHKGEINVKSRVGEGTTFTIRLPLDPRDERSENDEEMAVGQGI